MNNNDNVIEFKVYKIIMINQQERLACRVGKKWVMDRTCESINDMLDNGLITTKTITGWIEAKKIGS